MSDAEDMTIEDTDVGTLDDDASARWENAYATTAPENEIPDNANPELLRMTTEEISALKVLSWGDSVHRETCEACGTEMIFERHPADWEWHPGDPNDGTHVRVKIECPKCGHAQYTDGMLETEYMEELNAALLAQAKEEVLARLTAANGGKPVTIKDVRASDTGGGSDRAAAPPQ